MDIICPTLAQSVERAAQLSRRWRAGYGLGLTFSIRRPAQAHNETSAQHTTAGGMSLPRGRACMVILLHELETPPRRALPFGDRA